MERETSCITSQAALDYVKNEADVRLSEFVGNLDPELDELSDPVEYLNDPNNWISCRVMTTLFQRACHLLKDDSATYKIARHTVQKSIPGCGQRIIYKAIGSHRDALGKAQELNDRWSRNKTVTVLRQTHKSAVIRIEWHPEMTASYLICQYNKGLFQYLPLLWGDPPLTITERSCAFSGSPFCEYRLTWKRRPRIVSFLSRFWSSQKLLTEIVGEMEADKQLIRYKYEEAARLNRSLNLKIQQLTAVQETGKAILTIFDLGQLLDVIMPLLTRACRIERAAVLLINNKRQRLEYLHSIGYEDETPDDLKSWSLSLGYTRNIFARVANTGRSEYIPNVVGENLEKQKIFLKTTPCSAFVVPLIIQSKVIGVLIADTVKGRMIPVETRETLEIFSPLIAIAIENARLYGKLNHQRQMLKKSHRLLGHAEKLSCLGNLAARLTHEIKNPITAIDTFIQMLPKKFDDPEFRDNFYQIAREETGRINALLSELLDLACPRKPSFEKNDLHHLIDKTVLLFSPQSKASRIEVQCRYGPETEQVWMDREKIKQAILNVLLNALENTNPGGRVEISTEISRNDSHHPDIVVHVRDNGPGMTPSVQQKIFDPYFTTRKDSCHQRGTGLGLFIAHQNLAEHGGSITVSSRTGIGSCFSLSFPVNPGQKNSFRLSA